jgi:molybdopterin-guanine dinucleotide biosynthesis protein A
MAVTAEERLLHIQAAVDKATDPKVKEALERDERSMTSFLQRLES